ncbi:MAG: helix-turn-helix transcriptional regulator [Verrucomicrobia bacterium]|nr:helix-turn-helix transcriptional regulator [Verrucomicrobiota bacterium]
MPEPEAQKFVHHVVFLLKQRREAMGWSQRTLATRAGLDPKTVSLIERGDRSPTLFTLALLAEAMGVRLSEVLQNAEASTAAKS